MPYNTRNRGESTHSYSQYFEEPLDDDEAQENEDNTQYHKPPASRTRHVPRRSYKESSSESEEIDQELAASKRASRAGRGRKKAIDEEELDEPEEPMETIASSRPKRTVRKSQHYEDYYVDTTVYSGEEEPQQEEKPTRRRTYRRGVVKSRNNSLDLKRELIETNQQNINTEYNQVPTTATTHTSLNVLPPSTTSEVLESGNADNLFSNNVHADFASKNQVLNSATEPLQPPTIDQNTNHTLTLNNNDTSLNRSQSAISEQSEDTNKIKKRKKDEDDEDFVMDEDAEEAIEVSDDETISESLSEREEELELEEQQPRRTKRTKYNELDDEEEVIEEGKTGKDIKKRLRPRTQAQMNPYSHPSFSPRTEISIPSKITMLKEQESLLAPLNALKFEFSESDTDSDDEVENPMFGKKGAYDHIKPLNKEQLKKRPSADIDPLFSKPVGFDMVGGLHKHITALKEMVVLPLLYPEMFSKFDITPPRGVIFYGPPGTGKTLVARALASTCGTNTSGGSRPIAFFMRKGADVLSKWVGEAEKQLRLLFDEAKRLQPSIIFFDEIDGLAPVRSSKQDYVHSSIVSTLLALMDGLDSRGQVVVIGATNRIDSIDPALRRPGRFDRELLFTLPSKKARKDILEIHTRNWSPQLPDDLKNYIALKSVGYCGADIKALCAESALNALKRNYPQVYSNPSRLLLDLNSVEVTKVDFLRAMKDIVPAAHRNAVIHASPLPIQLAPCLEHKLLDVIKMCTEAFPICSKSIEDKVETEIDRTENPLFDDFEGVDEKTFEKNSSDFFINPPTFRPWILISAKQGMGQNYIASALLYHLEEFPLFSLRFENLIANTSSRSETEAIVNIISEARKNAPSIIWIPYIDKWFEKSTDLMKSTLISLLNDIPSSVHVLVLATTNDQLETNHVVESELFVDYRYEVVEPTVEERRNMFRVVLDDVTRPPLKPKRSRKPYPELPLAPPVALPSKEENEKKPTKLTRQEKDDLRELRISLREFMTRLMSNKVYTPFLKPPNEEQRRLITNNEDIAGGSNGKIYLQDILLKLEMRKYYSVKEFALDIERIVTNAVHYIKHPAKSLDILSITSKANALYDSVRQAIHLQIPEDLRRKCKQIAKKHRRAERTMTENAQQASSSSANTGVQAGDLQDQPIIVVDADAQQQSLNNNDVATTITPQLRDTLGVQEDQMVDDFTTTEPPPNQEATLSHSLIQDLVPTNTTASTTDIAPSSLAQISEERWTPRMELDLTISSNTNLKPTIEEEEEETDLPIFIDRDRLNTWFEQFISLTEGFSLEDLDKAFSIIYKTIYRHRFEQDRMTLLDELERYVKQAFGNSRKK
ncbi:hypothetical protein C9374_009600 [Naegleria lovaniensis]|uniref:Bromo domain-containing protein n=1 Tax=Naegleria lovaniensis TaxID=51637 RepID=A0AA88KPC7_NAELO|nr:uncharacterized protein C9374_009600 [Naegleria lovaniensis]KAG2393023.1 hypothetical protein C9374_009600 [Naegleria lovaniensis]